MSAVPTFLALLSSLLWGSADFLGGTLTRRHAAALVVALSQAAGLVAVAIVAAVTGAFADPTGYLPWAVAAGISGMLGLVCFYAALASGTMGVVSPVAALGVVVPVVIGLVRGERPAALQLVGIAVAIGGVVLASGPELSGRAGVRPVVLASLAAVGFGLAFVFIAEGSRSSALMTMVTMRVASVSLLAITALVLARKAREGWAAVSRRDGSLLVLTGLGDVAANLTYAIATQAQQLSVISVLGSLYPVVTVLLARVIHGERLLPVQTAGVVAALSGVGMIAAGGA